jgi:two-component system, chemotaxis family, sensor kinase CheA
MDDEILDMFLEDTREHLADIETDILDIEEGGPDFDPELVNKVFRTAHSIKGSAGFLGLDGIRDLSHKIENVLDIIRSGELATTSEVLNVILRGFDRLSELVDNHQESNDMDISGQVAALTNLIAAPLPQEEKKTVTTSTGVALPDGREIFTPSEHELKQAMKGGNFIYLVEFDLIHDVHDKGQTPFDLLQFLGKSGLIMDCTMGITDVGDLESEPSNRIPFYVLYSSILEPELVNMVLQVSSEYIHLVGPRPEDEKEAAVELGLAGPPGIDTDSGADVEEMERQFDQAAQETVAVQETVEGFLLHGDKGCGELRLEGNASLDRAEQVKSALLRGLELFYDMKIDLSGVEQADFSLLQLLHSARITGLRKGLVVTYGAGSPAVLEAAARSGFGAMPPEVGGIAGEEAA